MARTPRCSLPNANVDVCDSRLNKDAGKDAEGVEEQAEPTDKMGVSNEKDEDNLQLVLVSGFLGTFIGIALSIASLWLFRCRKRCPPSKPIQLLHKHDVDSSCSSGTLELTSCSAG
jgi:hypothetical protein